MLSWDQCCFSFLQFCMLMFVTFANFLKCRGHVVFPHKWLHSVLTCRRFSSLLTPCLLARCSSCPPNIFCKLSNLRKCLKKWRIQLFSRCVIQSAGKKMKKQTSKDISVKLPAIYFTSERAKKTLQSTPSISSMSRYKRLCRNGCFVSRPMPEV